MKVILSIAILLVVASVCVSPAVAASGKGFGARLGFSFDPDQFVIGVQSDTGRLFKVAHVVPSVDLGFGDHLTTFAFNADVLFDLPLPKSRADLYGGAGPTLIYWDPEKGDGDLEIGLSLVAGTRLPLALEHAYNLEVRFGVGDVPDVRVLLGVLFGAGRP